MKWILPIVLFAITAQADFRPVRNAFGRGRVPDVTALRPQTNWECVTEMGDLSGRTFTSKMFSFFTCLENPQCFYNNNVQRMPAWTPAWFSYANFGELGTTLPFKTGKLIVDCEGDLMSCDLSGDTIGNNMYIRTDDTGVLYVEWTADKSCATCFPTSMINRDQRAIAYGKCVNVGKE